MSKSIKSVLLIMTLMLLVVKFASVRMEDRVKACKELGGTLVKGQADYVCVNDKNLLKEKP